MRRKWFLHNLLEKNLVKKFLCIDISSNVWYILVMLLPKTYTPEQVAKILQLSKNTVYELISRGEIIAKKIGKVYRIPASSISFVFTGLDEDILKAQQEDEINIKKIHKVLKEVRKEMYEEIE